MKWTVSRLCAALGAEIAGVDVSGPLDDQQFEFVRRALGVNDGVLASAIRN